MLRSLRKTERGDQNKQNWRARQKQRGEIIQLRSFPFFFVCFCLLGGGGCFVLLGTFHRRFGNYILAYALWAGQQQREALKEVKSIKSGEKINTPKTKEEKKRRRESPQQSYASRPLGVGGACCKSVITLSARVRGAGWDVLKTEDGAEETN